MFVIKKLWHFLSFFKIFSKCQWNNITRNENIYYKNKSHNICSQKDLSLSIKKFFNCAFFLLKQKCIPFTECVMRLDILFLKKYKLSEKLHSHKNSARHSQKLKVVDKVYANKMSREHLYSINSQLTVNKQLQINI